MRSWVESGDRARTRPTRRASCNLLCAMQGARATAGPAEHRHHVGRGESTSSDPPSDSETPTTSRPPRNAPSTKERTRDAPQPKPSFLVALYRRCGARPVGCPTQSFGALELRKRAPSPQPLVIQELPPERTMPGALVRPQRFLQYQKLVLRRRPTSMWATTHGGFCARVSPHAYGRAEGCCL